jgi:hypothetical protein
MEIARKITVEVTQELLDKVWQASGAGITDTVRAGLQLVAAIANIYPATPTPRQGSLFAHVGRAHSGPIIAARARRSTGIKPFRGLRKDYFGSITISPPI